MSYLRLVDLSTDYVDSKLFYYLKFKLIKFIAFPIFSQFTPFNIAEIVLKVVLNTIVLSVLLLFMASGDSFG
jgi:hypothetical protein